MIKKIKKLIKCLFKKKEDSTAITKMMDGIYDSEQEFLKKYFKIRNLKNLIPHPNMLMLEFKTLADFMEGKDLNETILCVEEIYYLLLENEMHIYSPK